MRRSCSSKHVRLRQDQSQVDSKMEQLNAALDMTSRMHTSCAEQAAMQTRSLDQSHLDSMMGQLKVALDTSSELEVENRWLRAELLKSVTKQPNVAAGTSSELEAERRWLREELAAVQKRSLEEQVPSAPPSMAERGP